MVLFEILCLRNRVRVSNSAIPILARMWRKIQFILCFFDFDLEYTGAAWGSSSVLPHPCHMDGCWMITVPLFSSGCHFPLCLLLCRTLFSVTARAVDVQAPTAPAASGFCNAPRHVAVSTVETKKQLRMWSPVSLRMTCPTCLTSA